MLNQQITGGLVVFPRSWGQLSGLSVGLFRVQKLVDQLFDGRSVSAALSRARSGGKSGWNLAGLPDGSGAVELLSDMAISPNACCCVRGLLDEDG